jgi:Zn-dependent peptidase ImmA (M78 family)
LRLQELFYTDRPVLNEALTADQLIVAMRKFLEIAMEDLQLDQLPKIVWKSTPKVAPDADSFGRFMNHDAHIEVVIRNRHPIDIMRSLAHELVHYKQDLTSKLDAHSGDTGSDIENQANAKAGAIMRKFDEKYPQMFALSPVAAL